MQGTQPIDQQRRALGGRRGEQISDQTFGFERFRARREPRPDKPKVPKSDLLCVIAFCFSAKRSGRFSMCHFIE